MHAYALRASSIGQSNVMRAWSTNAGERLCIGYHAETAVRGERTQVAELQAAMVGAKCMPGRTSAQRWSYYKLYEDGIVPVRHMQIARRPNDDSTFDALESSSDVSRRSWPFELNAGDYLIEVVCRLPLSISPGVGQ